MRSMGLYIVMPNTTEKAGKICILKVGSEDKQEKRRAGGVKMEINKGSERAEEMVLTTCIKIGFTL